MSHNERAREIQLKMEISQTIRKRNGTKHRISKMIPEILGLVEQRGSRTEIRFLRTSLEETLKNAVHHHEALMLILPEGDSRFGDEWIDELALSVNSCFGKIERYLDSRKDDPPSSLLSSKKREDIQKWRENSRDQGGDSSLGDICGAFSKLYVDESLINGDSRSLPEAMSQNNGRKLPISRSRSLPEALSQNNDIELPISHSNEIHSTQNVTGHTNIETQSMQNMITHIASASQIQTLYENQSIQNDITHSDSASQIQATRNHIDSIDIISNSQANQNHTEIIETSIQDHTEPFNISTHDINTNAQPLAIASTSGHGGARARDLIPPNTGLSNSPVSSAMNLVSTYLNPNTDEFTPKLRRNPGYHFNFNDQLQSTYTVQPKSSTVYPPLNLSDESTPYNPNSTYRLSTTPAAPHANVASTTFSPHVNVNQSVTSSPHDDVITSSLVRHATINSSVTSPQASHYAILASHASIHKPNVRMSLNPQVNTSSHTYADTSLNPQVNTSSHPHAGTSSLIARIKPFC